MKIEDFKKLERKITGDSFNESYKSINKVLTFLSYFGHVASIFLAYFMLSSVLSTAITNSIVVGIVSVILLSGVELIKREMMDKFSISYLKEKEFNNKVIPLLLMSLLAVSLSFYCTISGAEEFSSKEKEIVETGKAQTKTVTDSITNRFNTDIKLKDKGVKETDSILNVFQTISLTERLSKDQRNAVADFTKKRDILAKEKKELELNRDLEIKKAEGTAGSDIDAKKQENSKSSLLFVLLSTLIELIIIAGIFFNEYYKFRSYNEYRDKYEKDPNYQKWEFYEKVLRVIYNEDTKNNEKLPPGKTIIGMCKINGILILPKEVTEFMKLLSSIGVIKVSGSSKYINKSRDLAFEALKKNFNIE
jgi:hypothetical protein